MNGEKDKILKMLEEGTITAEEAEELLGAVEEDEEPATISESYDGSNTPQFRSNWQQPFTISMLVLAASGFGLLKTGRSKGLIRLVGRILFLPATIVAALAAVVLYLSKDGPWLHMRIRSSDGDRFSFSLPFPLHILRGGLRLATSQAPDEETREKLDAAAEFLEAVESADISDPVTIDIQDEGDSIQIFLG